MDQPNDFPALRGFVAPLAENVGVHQEIINRIEGEKRPPSLRLLTRLPSVIEVEMKELVRVPGTENPKNQILKRLPRFASRRKGLP